MQYVLEENSFNSGNLKLILGLFAAQYGCNLSYNHIAPKYSTGKCCISEGKRLYLKHLQISPLKIKIYAKICFAINLIAI